MLCGLEYEVEMRSNALVIAVIAYAGLLVLTATVTLKVVQLGMEKMGKDAAKVNEIQ